MPAVEVVPDAPEFVPVEADGVTYMIPSVPADMMGQRQVSLSHRGGTTLDFGVTATVPAGYRLVLDLTPDLKERGLEVYKNVFSGEGRVTLGVRNLGREIVPISHRSRVVTARIEPVYTLAFKVKK